MPDPPFPGASTMEGGLAEVLKVRALFLPRGFFFTYILNLLRCEDAAASARGWEMRQCGILSDRRKSGNVTFV